MRHRIVEQGLDHFRIFRHEAPLTQVILVVVDHALAVGQHSSGNGFFGGGGKRIPDHPGIDMAAFKRCPCIGWRQIDRLHIAGLQAVLFQQPDQQVMHIAALVQRDFFALEFGNGLDDRVPGHQDGLGLRRCRVVADIGKLGSGGLRKDGRCLANEADIHCAQVQAFEQLGASRKLDPFHRRIERCQTLFQRALGFLQHEQTGRLLVADAQLCLLLCLRGGQQAQADGHCQPHNQQDADKQVTQHQRRGRSGSAKVGLINQGCSHGLGLLLNGERLNGCGLRAGMALPPTEKAVTQKNQKFRALAKQRPAASDATSHLRKRHSGVLRRRGQAKALGQQRGNGVIKPH